MKKETHFNGNWTTQHCKRNGTNFSYTDTIQRVQQLTGIIWSFIKSFCQFGTVLFQCIYANQPVKNLFQKKETPINEMQRFILENKNFLLFFVNIKIKIRRLAKNAAFISQYIHFTDWSSTLTACNLFLLFFSKV